MTSIKEVLAAKAKRPERTVPVCVAADLVDKHRIANAELAEMLEDERKNGVSARRLNAESPARAKAAEVRALEDEMADATVMLHLRAVDPAEWRTWRNGNPPRDDVKLDEQFGLNSDALLSDMVRRCIVDPEFDDDDWSTWCAEVANAEQLTVGLEVYAMHEVRTNVPKSLIASLVTEQSGDDSKLRLASE